ncbi:MAG: aminoglycoside phosphotransferase family protein [Eubacteriales bacterium]|nr:aminoglycoside phosphotransferase family protein [Eubacteriales bacterium]
MQKAIESFSIDGKAVFCERYGNGHINETYRVICDGGREYILQKINKHIFKRPDLLMENIASVCGHVSKKAADPRGALTIVNTKDGGSCHVDDNGEYWRVYDFITDSLCLESVEFESDFYESAVGFGNFQNMLSDFDAKTLHETIENFHNTPDRYKKFVAAVEKDAFGRAKDVKEEIEFALKREKDAAVLQNMLDNKALPLRVTHNDTKLNNVLFDAKTRKALCVIDLDTVMPGLTCYDFGDSIRFGATSAKEDEEDLSKVNFVFSLYKTYAEGFLSACGGALTKEEIETLPEGAKIMTLECGVRFLTDYLEGDTYFRIKHPRHNLVRCRTQFKLVSDMEIQWDKIKNAVN